MHDSDPIPANLSGILKRKSQYLFTCCLGNKFDTLHYARDNDMFDATILALGVLANKDRVDVCVRGLVPCDGTTGTDVSEKGEGTTESQV